ncbi:MAG: DUF3806 domain-containing protein [Pseudomonadales bacterium]|nr:DUF3806 domain-containing protein [Pseudomonadales bacterium]
MAIFFIGFPHHEFAGTGAGGCEHNAVGAEKRKQHATGRFILLARTEAMTANSSTTPAPSRTESAMKQIISAPDNEWIDYIARMWLLGNQISQDVLGEKMDGGPQDLDRLQRILNSGKIPVSNTQELQSLGILFGKVFVNETPHYDWWVVEDEYGKDACVRFKETTLLIFPQTMISKRVEDGEEINVHDMFVGLREKLEIIRKENYADI